MYIYKVSKEIKEVAEEVGIDKKVEDTFNLFIGKEQIKIMIFTSTKFIEENDRRSVMENIIKDGENGIVHARYKNTIVISKDEERLKRFIKNF